MIEFRDKEKFCRWNGTLMSPRGCKKLFGAEYEIYSGDGWFDDGEYIFTDKPIGEILIKYGEQFDKPEPYDPVLDDSFSGYKDHAWEERLGGNIMFSIDFIKNLKVKPLKDFNKMYPKFNRELHDAFYDELEEYYSSGKYRNE